MKLSKGVVDEKVIVPIQKKGKEWFDSGDQVLMLHLQYNE